MNLDRILDHRYFLDLEFLNLLLRRHHLIRRHHQNLQMHLMLESNHPNLLLGLRHASGLTVSIVGISHLFKSGLPTAPAVTSASRN